MADSRVQECGEGADTGGDRAVEGTDGEVQFEGQDREGEEQREDEDAGKGVLSE